MNKVILTFDYEIYFDGSHHYNALLENTNKILDSAAAHKMKLVFFIDIFYLIKLQENRLDSIYNSVRSQIKRMLSSGHEIEYHLHPHWIHSVYNSVNDSWQFDKSEYSFSDIIQKYGLEFAKTSFNQGIQVMRNEFDYKPCAYRSGGLSIDKNQEDLIQLLFENGFSYDSSVMPGLYLHGDFIHLDHLKAPNKSIWNIDGNSGFMSECSSSSTTAIKELPIMTLGRKDISNVKRVLTSIKYRVKGILHSKQSESEIETGKPFDLQIQDSIYPISITFDKSEKRDILLLTFFTSEYFKTKQNVMCILSHPKSFIRNSFFVFDSYLQWLLQNKDAYSVCGFSELHSN